MTLNEIQNNFHKDAIRLGDYQSMSKNELADGYVKAEKEGNQELISSYFSAIVLRYFYKIYKWIVDSRSTGLQDIDFVDWLVDAITYALKHKSWLNPEKAVYNDPNGFDKVINQCCESERLIIYQSLNKDKRKANVLMSSIDQQMETNGDAAALYLNAVEEEKRNYGVKDLVTLYLSKNKYLEALILDGIVNGDSFKETKEKNYQYYDDENGRKNVIKNYKITKKFDPRKLVKHLSNLDAKYMTFFVNEYAVDDKVGNEILNTLKKTSNTTLYTYIKKTFIEIRESKALTAYLIS